MKIATLLLAAASAVLAAPAAAPAPAPESELAARQTNVIYPHATFRYWINTGEVKEDPQDQLLVVKDGNRNNESSTIVTFRVGEEYEGRTCKLLFDLWDRDWSTGTQQMDVFSVIDPPGQFTILSIPSVRPASSRDKHKGRILAPKPGSATWLQAYDGYPEFPCPVGKLMGIEFVGVGDRVEVRWDIGVTGPRLQPLIETKIIHDKLEGAEDPRAK
ncbi:hypothetical protein CIHG_00247 [Coccidioides immitis H538.4]|uniref:Ubiquitin 3 binding protein But2 C-terminal domain-containing protein n=1 Tax=Coccidioides immitis H538.4 TaxID=396776 RepID=A0A0J8RB71_COCIT|nr:hypothetical protein CIHG_00247 [Coccidioides immitis H538.4]